MKNTYVAHKLSGLNGLTHNYTLIETVKEKQTNERLQKKGNHEEKHNPETRDRHKNTYVAYKLSGPERTDQNSRHGN